MQSSPQLYELTFAPASPEQRDPTSGTNRAIFSEAGITNAWDLRRYILYNSECITQYDRDVHTYESGAVMPPDVERRPGSGMPFMYRSCHDRRRPVIGYSDSAEKRQYLARQSEKMRTVAPHIPEAKLWNWLTSVFD